MNSKSKNNRTLRIRTFHGLLREAGLIQQKANLLAGYGVESTKDLKAEELEELIDYLRQQVQLSSETDAAVRRKRSNVMVLLNELGIYQTNGDWERVNRYLENPKICGKRLYECSIKEMDALCRKLRAIIRQRNSDIQKKMNGVPNSQPRWN